MLIETRVRSRSALRPLASHGDMGVQLRKFFAQVVDFLNPHLIFVHVGLSIWYYLVLFLVYMLGDLEKSYSVQDSFENPLGLL